jgi:type IV pilus assembly protein PilM
LSTKKVVVGVANQKVIVRQVDLAWMPENELRESLGLQVADLIPIPVEQAILDYHVLEEITTADGARHLRVLLVAADRDMVQGLLAAVAKAGLTATRVDLTPFAVLRAVGHVDEVLGGAGASEALVDIGATVTNIVVHDNGIPRFIRILPMGGDSVTDAVSERMGVPVDQAEGVKRQLGIAGAYDRPVDHPAAATVEQSVVAFLEEVRGSLDYYLAQPGSMPVQRIVISGGGARLRGLGQRLATTTRLPVEMSSVVSALQVGKTGMSDDELADVDTQIVVPVGLAMGISS